MRIEPFRHQTNFDASQKQYNEAVNFRAAATNPAADVLSLSNKSEKVTFKEGCGIVVKGFFGKIKDVFKTIVKHPLKTAALVGATTLGLACLPLIGISAATGAAGLAIGFATIAAGKTCSDVYRAIRHNKSGNYDQVRQDLDRLGGDILDLSLSLPFVPKGLKQIQRQMKFSPGIGLNQTLWSNVKNAKGFLPKIKELAKGDVLISYRQHLNEMGLKTAPELKFVEMPLPASGGFNPKTGELLVDSRALNPFTSNMYDGLLKHELKHFDQYSHIARAEQVMLDNQSLSGLDAIRKLSDHRLNEVRSSYGDMVDMMKSVIDEVKQQPASSKWAQLIKKFKLNNLEKNLKFMESADLSPGINESFWGSVVKNNGGLIKEGTAEAAKAQEYLNAWQVYPLNPMLDLRSYLSNLLEKEAYSVQKEFIKHRPGLNSNIQQEIALTTPQDS